MALTGCKRGALAEWLKGKGSPTAARTAFPVHSIDCPDGLARCVGGVVEASRVARLPQPCPPGPNAKCACPWDVVSECKLGCATDGVEIVAAPDRAAARLCAIDPSTPIARPAPTAVPPAQACDEAGHRCIQSLVVACSDDADGGALAGHVVAACLQGCAHEGESLSEGEADSDGAIRILCAH